MSSIINRIHQTRALFEVSTGREARYLFISENLYRQMLCEIEDSLFVTLTAKSGKGQKILGLAAYRVIEPDVLIVA